MSTGAAEAFDVPGRRDTASMYSWETSVVLVSNPADGVLLVRQAYGHRFFGLPGGVIERGESPGQAAERELLEETGLRVDGMRAVGTHELTYPEDGSWGSGKHFLAHVFSADRVIGIPAVQMPDEIESVGWHPMDSLPFPLTPSAHAVLAQVGR